jgi:LCP family protein required for cell wall assembly
MQEQPQGPSHDAAAAGGGASGPGPAAPPRGRGGPGAPGGPPDYHVYRSRRGPFSRLGLGDRLKLPKRRGGGGPPKEGRRWTRGRVAKIVLAAVAIWILVSVALFFVSAQTTSGVSEPTERALSGEGNLLTGATILVLGSDERPQRLQEQLIEMGQDPGEGGRADSILLLHVAFGEVRRLSILRDSFANIPGAESQKINAAYFIGGAPLMIETVEEFMGNGLQIDHLIEVKFSNFPDLIDALGGVDVNVENEICAPGYEGNAAGVNLDPGEHHLDGTEALEFARVRTNPCAPTEDDRARAARQQEVLSGIRSQALSPSTFVRLPWVSWSAPRAIRTDMRGPGLAALFAGLLTGGTGETAVLEPTGPPNADGSLPISEEARAEAAAELTGEE